MKRGNRQKSRPVIRGKRERRSTLLRIMARTASRTSGVNIGLPNDGGAGNPTEPNDGRESGVVIDINDGTKAVLDQLRKRKKVGREAGRHV